MQWQTKSRVLRGFDFLPSRAFFIASKYLLKSNGFKVAQDLPDAWLFARRELEAVGAQSTIEFGAGRHLGINQWLSDSLQSQTTVDISRMADPNLVRAMNRDLREYGHLSEAKKVDDLSDLNAVMGIDYRAPFDLLNLSETGQYDASFSLSTWEHVPEVTIPVLLKKLAGLVKRQGHIVAHIDYSDHYAHSDPGIDRLNFLGYPIDAWEKHNHRHLYQNRLRHSQYQKIFEDLGFRILVSEASNYVEEPKNPPLVENLTGEDTDFATTGRWVLQTS